MERLDQVFERPVAPISMLAGSSRGGDVRDLTEAPDFVGLGDLGVDLALPKRVTMVVAAPEEEDMTGSSLGTDSSLGSESSPELSVREALGEAARGLEEEAAEEEERQFERDLDLAFEEWVRFVDRLPGPAPEFDFALYLAACPYKRVLRKGDMFRRAEPSEWPCDSDV